MIKSGYNDPSKSKRWKLFWATLNKFSTEWHRGYHSNNKISMPLIYVSCRFTLFSSTLQSIQLNILWYICRYHPKGYGFNYFDFGKHFQAKRGIFLLTRCQDTCTQPSRHDSCGRKRRLQGAKLKTRQSFRVEDKQTPSQIHIQQTQARTRREHC